MRYKLRQQRKMKKYELKYGYKTAKKEEKTERTALRQSARVATAEQRAGTIQAGFGAAGSVLGQMLGGPQQTPQSDMMPLLLIGGMMAVGAVVVATTSNKQPAQRAAPERFY